MRNSNDFIIAFFIALFGFCFVGFIVRTGTPQKTKDYTFDQNFAPVTKCEPMPEDLNLEEYIKQYPITEQTNLKEYLFMYRCRTKGTLSIGGMYEIKAACDSLNIDFYSTIRNL